MSAPAQARRRFVGRKDGPTDKLDTALSKKPLRRAVNQIPADILQDEELNAAIQLLPRNYNFEIHKTVWNIRKLNAKRVALQMPEGLLIYACIVSDILEQFCQVETVVMGDVTYGACCIDDFTAVALGCDILIHYAHSCLVPIDVTKIKVLYVFVTIDIDKDHLVNTINRHLANKIIALVSTIQFNPTLHQVVEPLAQRGITAISPQAMPLSKGEVLGCTSARLDKTVDAIVYIGDGRFHLESAMIHNPEVPAYKYDPYNKEFTVEEYGHEEMQKVRRQAIIDAKHAKKVGLILGTLGRQGNPLTLNRLKREFAKAKVETVMVMLSEIFPQRLAQFPDVDCWVQVACPRLSIDWGYAFPKPLLTPYEAMVALNHVEWMPTGSYPMDYYSTKGWGRGHNPWPEKDDSGCCGSESCSGSCKDKVAK